MPYSDKNMKNGRRKKEFKWHKEKRSKLKDEDGIINSLQKSYEDIDTSKVSKFKDLPLSQKTLKGLKECGYVKMTEIQQESIGLGLRGLDILGAAKTGSGKTLAFLIPVLEVLYCKKWTRLDGVGALIITPTRELAYQIFETLRRVGAYHDISGGLIIGGKDLHFEKKRMNQCNVMICTPGRLLQHMDENPLFDCTNLQILVLDEADRCLDLGFEATMNSIIENLPPKRQTLLFSATQTKSVRDLARLSLKDPMYVSVHEHAKHSTPESLQQSYVVCELQDKLNMLWSFIKSHLKYKILVFISSCKQVKYFYEIFCRLRPGTTLLALYGTLHQMRRMEIYDSFCRKSNAVLLATDIAARGLDFPEVNWVVQLDCPEDANTYIHRAGRTARYHKGGESLLVLLPSEEEGMVEQLNAAKIPINKIRINPNKLQNPRVKIEAFLAKDVKLKESAQRACVSYVKSVYLMKNKQVFNMNAVDWASFSRSLGLAVAPRIRFLQKLQKKQNLVNNNISQPVKYHEPEESEEDSASDEHVNTDEGFTYHNEDSDSDEDILKIKRKDHELAYEEVLPEEVPHNINTKKKPITKVAVAKKILKKKIIANKRIVFNEDGEAVLNVMREKTSRLAREYEAEEKGGIDIEKNKQLLREEDKYDKQLFREKVKAERRKKKLKLKKEKEMKDEVVDESGDEENDVDLSWLPDPDEVYSDRTRVPSEQRNGEEEESNIEPDVPLTDRSAKRKASQQSNKKKKKKKKYQEDVLEHLDTGLSLIEDEELALHILKQK